MEVNSEKAKRFKIIDGNNAHALQPRTPITRKDIKEFLARFAEAIHVDQRRVNKLPRECFPSLYEKGMWKRCRERRLEDVIELSMTVDGNAEALTKNVYRDVSRLQASKRQVDILGFDKRVGRRNCPVVLQRSGSGNEPTGPRSSCQG